MDDMTVPVVFQSVASLSATKFALVHPLVSRQIVHHLVGSKAVQNEVKVGEGNGRAGLAEGIPKIVRHSLENNLGRNVAVPLAHPSADKSADIIWVAKKRLGTGGKELLKLLYLRDPL